LDGYLTNTGGPVSGAGPITYERWGSSSNHSINGYLHYPKDIDRSLNEVDFSNLVCDNLSVDADNIRKYHSDYNNNPPNAISFVTDIAGTSGRCHSEFVLLLF
jgi:hypothetical protein